MEESKRARRMQRHHRRNRSRAGFNLVSLMDIFTILVFFLLVNSSDVQTLPDPKELELPESTAEAPARESIVVMLGRNNILVQGNVVMGINEAIDAKGEFLPAVAQALKAYTPERITAPTEEEMAEEGLGEITIMSDKNLPFSLVKKVMLTCTQAEYGQISLAVLQDEQLSGI
jgi:biopolymer transport protein ExbD